MEYMETGGVLRPAAYVPCIPPAGMECFFSARFVFWVQIQKGISYRNGGERKKGGRSGAGQHCLPRSLLRGSDFPLCPGKAGASLEESNKLLVALFRKISFSKRARIELLLYALLREKYEIKSNTYRDMNQENNKNIAIFGGGCFWCTEAVFDQLKGILSVIPGYAGGTTQNPTYEQVSMGNTGHAEVIRVEYNPKEIRYRDLLRVFFATHDPTTPNRQGADVGTEYRSLILYTTEEQKHESQSLIKELKQSGLNVVTEVKPLDKFYQAEEYHKKFYKKQTSSQYCQVVINPKLQKLKEHFPKLGK